MIGMVMSKRPELYPYLHTILSLEDLYDIVESIMIDLHNEALVRKHQERESE